MGDRLSSVPQFEPGENPLDGTWSRVRFDIVLAPKGV